MNWIFWIVLAVVLATLEIITPSVFFFMCLAIGALFAAVATFFDVSNWFEFGIFITVSIVSIYTIRPLFKKLMSKSETVNSNVDALIGAQAVVTEKISLQKAGFVKVNGEIWLAESDGEIESGETVKIKSVSGTKVFVKK
ncbi:NfeD family protein [Endomicrobium proavitum]|uniref:Inner membrane protein n=1 Tax=Endomicrobium proavitum TaxID=1408281 RepID=A0A0G3WHZ4_9BACT|nr:NfeD family protein [Endomicrobium proavitum]AKL97477.1 inner membrane protein [Endomicrobium proavitum]